MDAVGGKRWEDMRLFDLYHTTEDIKRKDIYEVTMDGATCRMPFWVLEDDYPDREVLKVNIGKKKITIL